jgi:plastocyanin
VHGRLALLALIAACYSPPKPDCGFLCGPQGACPQGYTCGADNVCKRNGTPDSLVCPPPVDAAIRDARVIDSPDAVPDALVDAVPDALGDAAPDAMALVLTVTCPGTPDATVTTSDAVMAYSPPSVSIPQNGIVEFQTSSLHDVVPDATGSDPGLAVGFNQTKCLQFTATGTFGFHCGPHGFTGSVTVN